VDVNSEPATFLFEVLPPAFIDRGEIDLELGFEDDALELALHEDSTGRDHFPDETVLIARPASRSTVPNDPQFGFLGAPGSRVFVLPQAEMEGVLSLGLAADELEAGVFVRESVEVRLVSLTGPGQLAVYETDSFGAPTVFWNSANGLDGADVVPAAVGSHRHAHWALTAPGVYRVGLIASGQLAADNRTIESEVVTVTFLVQDNGLALTAALIHDGAQLQIAWESATGVSYQLQSRTTLGSGAWQDEGPRVSGNGGQRTVTVERGTEPLKLFRLAELQP
jgi:surface-anchored protein